MSCKWLESCPLRKLEEQGEISDKWKKNYCDTDKKWKGCARYQASQNNESHSVNLMPDGSILGVNS